MWLIVGQIPIKAGWWDASLALWDFSQSNKALHPALCNKDSPYLSLLQCPYFRNSRPELYCEKSVLKNVAKFTGVSSGTRVSCEFCDILKNTFFSQNTSSGYFWHFHQSRFSILILYVINQLRHKYVTFLSLVQQKLHFRMYFPQNNHFLH